MNEFKLTPPEPLRIHGVDITYYIYVADRENGVDYFTKTTDAAKAIQKFNDAATSISLECTISDTPIIIDADDYVSLDGD